MDTAILHLAIWNVVVALLPSNYDFDFAEALMNDKWDTSQLNTYTMFTLSVCICVWLHQQLCMIPCALFILCKTALLPRRPYCECRSKNEDTLGDIGHLNWYQTKINQINHIARAISNGPITIYVILSAPVWNWNLEKPPFAHCICLSHGIHL